jgi:trehalose-phosphatase
MTPELDRALREFASRPPVLVALDFDGVLAPIVEDRDAARPLPESVTALERLAALPNVTLALVSGRTMADLKKLAAPPPGTILIASHGAELDDPASGDAAGALLDTGTQALLADVQKSLREIVDRHPGTDLESKPAGAVLHTRTAERDVADDATRAALEGPATWPGVHAMQGKEVVELSVLDTDKGTALQAVRERLEPGDHPVLYAGDDVTDENAFAMLRDGDVGIKIGEGETKARWRVEDPMTFARLLHHLADLL